MAKAAPVEAKVVPSIRFTVAKRQHETGIDFVQSNGIKTKITPMGYTAISMADEMKILAMMKNDPFCGIATWENREMGAEQKMAETQVRAVLAQNASMMEEMDALREQVKQLQGAKA